MMRIFFVFFMILGICFSSALKGDKSSQKVKPLEWIGDKKPGTYEEYKKTYPEKPFKMEKVGTYSRLKGTARSAQNKIIVMVSDSIYSTIWYEIYNYTNDIRAQGYDVVVLKGSGGSPEDIKYELTKHPNLLGCIMVGHFPSAWYELENDYGYKGYAEFPCDLFYMDLDGFWCDQDLNGKYDLHNGGLNGDTEPEIFVARIDATGMWGYEMPILKNYFSKNHSFWNKQWDFTEDCYAYTEDDWIMHPDLYNHMIFFRGNLKRVKAPNTDRDNYLNSYLSNPLYYVGQLVCHSNSYQHGFTRGGTLNSPDVKIAPPQSICYNLICCSALRYTDHDCLGKNYIFNNGRGLVVVGSTKVGAMLHTREFYEPLGNNRSVGESFLQWFQDIAPYDMNDVYWHYGMTILGDPMIHLKSIPGTPMILKSFRCPDCDYIYDPAIGDPENGFPPGTRFGDLPNDWCCPECGTMIDEFEVIE